MMRSESTETRRRRSAPRWLRVGLALAVLVPTAAWAGQVVGLITFVNGDPADADEVNANFSALTTAVNDNDTRLQALEILLGADCPVDQFVTGFSAGAPLVCAP